MCGVFGFASLGERMNLETLRRIAHVTMSRGADAWGMAWIDRHGRLKMFKKTGRIVDSLALLAMAADAEFLIGHCRFATNGTPNQNVNNHPHPSDGGWIVHNGVIRNYQSVISRFDLHPTSDCDSEVLGLLIEQTAGDLAARCRDAVLSVERSPLVMLGLWKNPGRIVAVRQGNPLHLGRVKGAAYLGSLAAELPGKMHLVRDGSVVRISAKGLKAGNF